MFDLKKNKDQLDFNKLKKFEPQIKIVLEKIIEFLCTHINNQKKAGANIVQIFDSWAGLVPKKKLFDYCYKPNKKIVDFCKKNNIPVICFPKGIKKKLYQFCKKS